MQIEAWHVVTTLGAVLLAIYKQEINNVISSCLFTWKRRHLVGSTIQIQDPSGVWADVRVIGIRPEVLYRPGGILLQHDVGEKLYQERIPISVWRGLRKRNVAREGATPGSPGSGHL